MSLPLKARKNIRDYEPKIKESLEKIKDNCDIDFEFECDYQGVYTLLKEKLKDSDYLERLGEAVYWYVDPFADSIVEFCKDPLQKEAIVEGATAKKISFKIVKDPFKSSSSWYLSNYGRCIVENGVLVITVPAQNFPANVSEVGSSLKVCFDDPKAMSLMCRKNIAQNNEKLQENLEKLKDATGIDFEIEVDFGSLVENWKKGKSGLQNSDTDRIGEYVYDSYLGGLTYNIERLCQDDLGKEAFTEAMSAKTINIVILSVLKKGEYFYSRCRIADGKLILEIPAQNFPCNVSEAGSDIEKLL